MKEIICITDYKNCFGSKFNSFPYRSGFDKTTIKQLFQKLGFDVNYFTPSQIHFGNEGWRDKVILYTSSEEYNLYYKNFIEDVVIGLHETGATVIPNPLYLRANNNKVFMEILSQIKLPKELHNLSAYYFGTFDELQRTINDTNLLQYPCVVKSFAGAKSRGVFLANNKNELLKKAKVVSNTFFLKVYLKEKVREIIHKQYLAESSFQNKFLIQPFVPGLLNDWKIVIYGDKYFVLKRNVRTNDFRASGSGLDYKSGSEAGFPLHMLDYLRNCFLAYDVPNLSIDFGYDGKQGYIFEHQAIHFGTYTQSESKDYYEYIEGKWLLKENTLTTEEAYVSSIVDYLNRNNKTKL
jgi:hypothetical protein